ncbi:MAG TPA: bifunctional alpha,alpha-trehalose-phosphate synthase (UDP-forming)/trehalose-phosphatase [Gaiellaceae bacterium]
MDRSPRGDLVIASNRLPITLNLEGPELGVEPSSGGLVTALQGAHRPHVWVGWPGAFVPDERKEEATRRIVEEGCEPVYLTEAEEDDFYGQICNDSLWPLFHYFVDRLRFTREAWATYVAVNERFAEVIARVSAPKAQVWIHDFHLMLVPRMLRRRRPDLGIGFFLHVPFPSSEIYRILPSRSEVLHGLLGSDYIGFHTGDYARHFRSACLRVLGIEPTAEAIEYDDRTVGIGVHPIGIDVKSFLGTLADPETAAVQAELEQQYAGKKLVLGVERLDYTKGIPQKLDAFERILEQDPARAEDVTMLQVLVPSRLQSADYREKRDEIEMRIAHVNGRFGGLGRTPLEYVHLSISRPELAALYRRADVMMVTPLRDGMNLVAQEFVLCQADVPELAESRQGALLLSEFAGAAHVLPGAVLVNPWDADNLATRLLDALALDPVERRRRQELMADRVAQLDSRNWAEGFLRRLDRFAVPARRSARPLDETAREHIAAKLAAAPARAFMLDYDGTLRELVDHPDLAAPTDEIRALLNDLSSLPDTTVHIVSGRARATLDPWLGDLPVYLSAEHGYITRHPDGRWETVPDIDLSWMPRVEYMLRRVVADVPGTLLEHKTAGLAWHYREAEPEYGSWRARELLVALGNLLAGAPAEVLPGHRVIEVRARGVNKGAYLDRALPDLPDGTMILAAGDDLTDVDLFRRLPADAVAIHVGSARPRAANPSLRDRYVVDTPGALRDALRRLVVDLRVLSRPGSGRRPAIR